MSQVKGFALALAMLLVLGTSTLASRTSMAQSADAPPPALEEIVVTARKREESLRDISAAVSVVGAEQLRNGGISDVRDLQNIAPELNVGEVVGLMKITMRGLGNTSNTRGEDTEVAFYVDGAVVARQEAQSMAMFDLERIEVLRGPQGTLYGRNSTGGMLNLITAKPADELSGYVNVTGGNYGYLRLDGALSGPVSERILGRIAVQSIARDGFSTNITTGNEIDDDRRQAVRGHLQFDFTDDVQLLLSGEYAEADDASGLFTYFTPLYVVGPPAPPGQEPKGLGGLSDPASRDGAGNIDPELERDSGSLTGTFTWDLNESVTLKNILNWRDMDYYLAQDLDLSSVVPTPVTNTATVSIPLYDRQLSNELQLTYAGERLTLIGGVYWFTEDLRGRTSVGETPTQAVWFYREGESHTDSYAGFFNVNYDFTRRLTGRIGGRYNHDEREIDNWQWVLGTFTIPPNSPTNPANDERTDSEYTGEYGLDFRFSERGLLYYTFSQGYRPGAAVIMQVNNPIIGPTTVANHELGFKLETFDGTFGLNIAAYDAEINDLQRTQAVPLPGGAFTTLINNISGMEVKGVELSAQWRPVSRLSLWGSTAYTDAEFLDYVTDDPLQFGNLLVQLAGNTPQLAPEWKGNLAGEWAIPVAGGSDLVLGANATYVGKQFFDEFDRAPMLEDSYTVWDASLTYRPAAGNWSVGLWGRNLGDEEVLADMTFSALGRVVSKKFINPRTYGAVVSYQF